MQKRTDEDVLHAALLRLDDKVFESNLATTLQSCFFDRQGQMVPFEALTALISLKGDTSVSSDPADRLLIKARWIRTRR